MTGRPYGENYTPVPADMPMSGAISLNTGGGFGKLHLHPSQWWMIAWQAAGGRSAPAKSTRRGPAKGTTMGYVRHTGKIGTLAVALGVGAALTTTPAISSAAPPDSASADAHSEPTAGESSTDERSPSTRGSSRSGAFSLSPGSVDSLRKSVLRGANALTAKARRSIGAGTSTAVVAAVEQQDSPTPGERNAPFFVPARGPSVTEWIDRLPSITVVTGGREPAVKGRGPATADELSASTARLSTPSTAF